MAANETLKLGLALTTGILLGSTFFGGLWWTVRRGVLSKRPALWFAGSFLLRLSIVLVGFYYVSTDHWEPMLLCLLGFVLARHLAMRLTRVIAKPTQLAQEANHASKSG